jgi:cob(I)alamin adenosyltransferase
MSVDRLERMPVLKAYLGANGVLTAAIENEAELRRVIAQLFRVNVELSLYEIQEAITELGKQKRRILVRKNLMDLPARLVSQKRAHAKKRGGVMYKKDRKAAASLIIPKPSDDYLTTEFKEVMCE